MTRTGWWPPTFHPRVTGLRPDRLLGRLSIRGLGSWAGVPDRLTTRLTFYPWNAGQRPDRLRGRLSIRGLWCVAFHPDRLTRGSTFYPWVGGLGSGQVVGDLPPRAVWLRRPGQVVGLSIRGWVPLLVLARTGPSIFYPWAGGVVLERPPGQVLGLSIRGRVLHLWTLDRTGPWTFYPWGGAPVRLGGLACGSAAGLSFSGPGRAGVRKSGGWRTGHSNPRGG